MGHRTSEEEMEFFFTKNIIKILKYHIMLFNGSKARIVKNCDLGLEKAARGWISL